MDDRERHQGGRDQNFGRRRERSGGPSEESFGQSGQAGYGESSYAQGRLSSTSGYGPQALGQGGHIQSHEGDFGYVNTPQSGYGYGFGSPGGGRGQDHRDQGGYGQGDYGQGGRGQGGYGQRGGPAFAQGQGDAGYPGSQYSGGEEHAPEGGSSYGGGRGGYPGSQYAGGPQPRRGDAQPPSSGQGGGIGFGQGGAFQQGWGGQSDHQRHDMGHDDHPDRPGQGGGTYGQGQYGAGARRSEFRDEQRYSGGMHQNQGGQGGVSGHSSGHDHEPDYVHYKSSRLADLDREHHERRTAHERELDEHYNEFREHKRTKFGREFEDWRSQRGGGQTMAQGASGGNTGANLSSGSGADRDEERSKSLSSPGGGALPTDKTGVGDLTPPSPGGGAGMQGAGAVGGSSATMAAGTAGPGAPNPSTGASDAGVTTSSENRADKPR